MAKAIVETNIQEISLATSEPTANYEQFCEYYERATIWIDYTKGNEDSISISVKARNKIDEELYNHGEWVLGQNGVHSFLPYTYQIASEGRYYLTFDILGISYILINVSPNGLDPTGLVSIKLTLKGEARG